MCIYRRGGGGGGCGVGDSAALAFPPAPLFHTPPKLLLQTSTSPRQVRPISSTLRPAENPPPPLRHAQGEQAPTNQSESRLESRATLGSGSHGAHQRSSRETESRGGWGGGWWWSERLRGRLRVRSQSVRAG